MIEPLRIIEQEETTLYGRPLVTRLANYQVGPHWKSFRQDLAAAGANDQERFYSVQVYPEGMKLSSFTPQTDFHYWAAIEASPIGVRVDALVIPAGTYAVFLHHGTQADFSKTLGGIYTTWLPQSGYRVDDRPHYEVLGKEYLGATNPDSKEEVFVPIFKE